MNSSFFSPALREEHFQRLCGGEAGFLGTTLALVGVAGRKTGTSRPAFFPSRFPNILWISPLPVSISLCPSWKGWLSSLMKTPATCRGPGLLTGLDGTPQDPDGRRSFCPAGNPSLAPVTPRAKAHPPARACLTCFPHALSLGTPRRPAAPLVPCLHFSLPSSSGQLLLTFQRAPPASASL